MALCWDSWMDERIRFWMVMGRENAAQAVQKQSTMTQLGQMVESFYDLFDLERCGGSCS